MESWIILSLAGAAFQTLRFMLQKTLSTGRLSPGGATYARFFYSTPFVLGFTAFYLHRSGIGVPDLSAWFWGYSLFGAVGQVLATWCVVALFAQRNFAVGTTFKKTEVVMTAFFGLLVLGDLISLYGFAAIVLGLVGVLILSDMPALQGRLMRRVCNRAAGLGLASGVLFALSGVGYRGATLEIASADPILRASVTLSVVTTSQVIGMTLWLAWREAGQIGRVIAARRTAVWMGVTGMAGSLCWFTAFTQQNAAYVFAVGQIEVIFSVAASVFFFGERITWREALGMALVTLSVLGVGLFH